MLDIAHLNLDWPYFNSHTWPMASVLNNCGFRASKFSELIPPGKKKKKKGTELILFWKLCQEFRDNPWSPLLEPRWEYLLTRSLKLPEGFRVPASWRTLANHSFKTQATCSFCFWVPSTSTSTLSPPYYHLLYYCTSNCYRWQGG